MRSQLLTRSLLASAAALTLSSAASVDKRQTGTACGYHLGYIIAQNYTSEEENYVRTIFDGGVFSRLSLTEDTSDAALFRFEGCAGGDSFVLYCISCDPSGNAVAGIRSDGYDANGEPNNWVFYNMGPDAEDIYDRDDKIVGRQATKYSVNFKWGEDDIIRPVTYNQDGSIQGIVYDAYYDGALTNTGHITFIESPGTDDYFNLVWYEAPRTR